VLHQNPPKMMVVGAIWVWGMIRDPLDFDYDR